MTETSIQQSENPQGLGEAEDARAVQPAVSIVTIFFEAERYLRAAIESVLAQTFDDWELLLVDDGSTDGGPAIAREFAAKYPGRICYVTHPGGVNQGMSASRNLGIAESRGDLIAFLDADDVWMPFKLTHQVDLLSRAPDVGMVYGPTEYWYSWTGDPADRDRDFLGRLAVEPGRKIDAPELLIRSLETHGGMLPGICSLVVRRSVLEEIGGFDPSFRGSYEDQVFFSKVFRHASVLITDRCSDRYRQHEDSCCAVAQRNGEYDPDGPHPARERFLQWLEGYLAEHPLEPGSAWSARLRSALDREWLPYKHPLRHSAKVLGERVKRMPLKLLKTAKKRLPEGLRSRLRRRFRDWRFIPPVGWVRFGSFRSLAPISRDFGFDRGTPIDRHYVEAFLARHSADIRGRVLEVGDDTYTRRFGGDAVVSHDVLHVQEGAHGATIVADLANAPQIASDSFDCIILTQTLQYVFDLRGAVETLHRILAPGGVVLATAPGMTQIVECPWRENWFWGLTQASANALFLERFPLEKFQVESPGNVVTATAFLQGVAAEELRQKALDHDDRDYQLLVTIRAEKPTEAYMREMSGRWDYTGRHQDSYGDDTTYEIGMEFLDLPGAQIEDWGCGLTYARKFVKNAEYIGVDGSASRWTDKNVDLCRYRSEVDCIFLRHVLEHNPNWEPILDNALHSFQKRMALIVFTPFGEETRELMQWSGIPDISFRKEDLTSRFPADVTVVEKTVETKTQYGVETLFLLERDAGE